MAYLLWKLTRSISSFISAIALISRILVIHLNATERRSETCERSAFVGKCLVYTYQYRKQKSNAKVFSTYIHNWSLQPLVRIIDLVSHITYVVCVNFIHKWRDPTVYGRLRTTDFLRNFSWQFYLRSEFLPEIC